MSKIFELKNDIEDLYEEHLAGFHKPPYWRLKNRCSECFKAHTIAVKRGSYLKEKIHNSPESSVDFRHENYKI